MMRLGRFVLTCALGVAAVSQEARAALGPVSSAPPADLQARGEPAPGAPGAEGAAKPRAGTPRGGARGRELPSPEGRTVAEIEQLFDNYVVRQARQFLRLTPEQMRDFGPRLRQLQVTRRRTARQRQMLLRELNDLTRAPGTQDEAAITAKMSALDQQNTTADQQLRDAYQAVEQVLTVQQRGRLRIFEQQMERQKLDLMARAREVARGRGRDVAPAGAAEVPAADLPGR